MSLVKWHMHSCMCHVWNKKSVWSETLRQTAGSRSPSSHHWKKKSIRGSHSWKWTPLHCWTQKQKKKSQKQTMLQWDMSLHTWLYWMYHIKAHLSNVLYTSFCHCIIFCTFLHHFHSQLQLLYMLNVFLTFKAILFSMLLFSVFLPPDLMSFIWLIFFSLCIYYYYKQIHPKQILCTLFLLYSVFDLTSALEHHSVSSSWGRCPPTSESAQHSLRWPEERAQKLLSLMTNYMEALNIFDIWNWYKCC